MDEALDSFLLRQARLDESGLTRADGTAGMIYKPKIYKLEPKILYQDYWNGQHQRDSFSKNF